MQLLLVLVVAIICGFAALGEGLSVNLPVGFRSGWKPATATWYGAPDGAGTDGGACGYGNLIGTPYGKRVSAGSPVLFKGGLGCGACYKVKCLIPKLCARKAVRVVITDECPGGYCSGLNTHFDLSGTAFSGMANPGLGSSLLNLGLLPMLYKRVPCVYRRPMKIEVAAGSSPFWFSVLIKFVRGSGELKSVELQQGGTNFWYSMQHIWGANWSVNVGSGLKGPFTLRLTCGLTGQQLVIRNVIPSNWTPATTYPASVNFRV